MNDNLNSIDKSLRSLNRARFADEVSHGIFELLESSGHNRSWLADRLGCSKSAISKLLAGPSNLTIERLADITLAFGRGVHIVLGDDPSEMRLPVDEAFEGSASDETSLPSYRFVRLRQKPPVFEFGFTECASQTPGIRAMYLRSPTVTDGTRAAS